MQFQISDWLSLHGIYRGYYTVARRYEFYFRCGKTIFYERAHYSPRLLFKYGHVTPFDILEIFSEIKQCMRA